jgi:hypothetical protein
MPIETKDKAMVDVLGCIAFSKAKERSKRDSP